MSIFTVQGADGRALQAAQPSGGVVGSPFTVDAITAVPTPAMTGLCIVLATVDTHISFTKDGTDADANDIFIPAAQWFSFPVDGDILSLFGTGAGSVYVELAKEL